MSAGAHDLDLLRHALAVCTAVFGFFGWNTVTGGVCAFPWTVRTHDCLPEPRGITGPAGEMCSDRTLRAPFAKRIAPTGDACRVVQVISAEIFLVTCPVYRRKCERM